MLFRRASRRSPTPPHPRYNPPMPLTVALIVEHFTPHRSVAAHLAFWLAGQLAQSGVQVHVICHDVATRVNRYRVATRSASHDADLSRTAHPIEAAIPPGVQVHRLKGLRLNSALGLRRFGRKARAWCQRHKPDVVHSMTVAFPGDLYHPHAGVYDIIQAQSVSSRSTPAAANFKRLLLKFSPKQRSLLTLEKRAVAPPPQGAAKIISVCPMMARHFHETYGVADDRLVLLEDPLIDPLPDTSQTAADRAWFRGHYGFSADQRLALFVGHDFRRKGLRWAIEAVAATQTHWKLVIAGLGKVREYIETVELAGLEDRIKFIGPTREIARVYAAADALILPTFYDAWGLVVIEALSHGLPVISTDFLGASDLVRRHNVGTIVPTPRDVAAMTAALDALPTDPTRLAALAQRARNAAEGMPGPRYVAHLIDLYRRVIAEKRPRR
jgi:UDP-glucose:(heptosyl)LPS alpha-1,3-glucosyltransferase